MSVPTVFYGGPRDGAKFHPIAGAGDPPQQIPGPTGRYVQMDEMPYWMTFLPTRPTDAVIYIWEEAASA